MKQLIRNNLTCKAPVCAKKDISGVRSKLHIAKPRYAKEIGECRLR